MPGLVTGDILDVIIVGDLLGQQIISKFNYVIIGDSTATDVITACTTFAGSWKAGAVSPFLSFLACCPPEYTAEQVRVQKIAPVRYVPGVNNVGLPGTNDQHATTANLASTITRSGQLSGRPYISTLHVPGLSGTNVANGELVAGFKVLLGTCASKILNDFIDLSDGTTYARPCIYHRRKPPLAPLVQTNLFRAVSGLTARTMRRRTVGIGK